MIRKKLPFPVFVAGIVVLTVLFVIFAFYYAGFQTLNQLITEANKGTPFTVDEAVISQEDLEKLTFVEEPRQDTFYVNGSCLPMVKKLGFGKIVFFCEAEYTVYAPFEERIIQEIGPQSFSVEMRFVDFKWIVTDVSRE